MPSNKKLPWKLPKVTIKLPVPMALSDKSNDISNGSRKSIKGKLKLYKSVTF